MANKYKEREAERDVHITAYSVDSELTVGFLHDGRKVVVSSLEERALKGVL